MDLARIFAAPRPLTFGGRAIVARPFKLRQLGELQAWLCAFAPHPMEEPAAAKSLADPDPDGRARAAAALIAEADGWPVAWGTPLGDVLLGTVEGQAEVLRVAGIAEPPEEPTAGEWAALGRVLYGVDPLLALLGIVDPTDGGSDGAPGWGKILVEFAELNQYRLAEVGELTLDQLQLLRHGGEVPGPAIVPREGESFEDALARRAALFPDPEPDPEPDPDELAADQERWARMTEARADV